MLMMDLAVHIHWQCMLCHGVMMMQLWQYNCGVTGGLAAGSRHLAEWLLLEVKAPITPRLRLQSCLICSAFWMVAFH
jgi:hypothetical protein